MARIGCLTVLALALLATPASAFQTCTYDGTATVTATFGTETTGTLVRSGNAIHSEDGACGAATVTNTDTIVVNGDAEWETFTIDLTGGPFAPGIADEPGASEEIEFDVNVAAGFPSGPALSILGTPGPDAITVGVTAPNSLSAPTLVNLNANEPGPDGVDPDVALDAQLGVSVSGSDGSDVLDGAGGEGIPARAIEADLSGGDGNDDLTIGGNQNAFPGEGDDEITTVTDTFGNVSYASALQPIEVTLQDGTGGAPGGGTATGKDGFGDTDSYFGVLGIISATNAAAGDLLNGGPNEDTFHGGGGPDVINGGGGDDSLSGDSGVDTIHGDGGADVIRGDAGDDSLHGDAGNDTLDGTFGDDHEFGDEGDDLFRQAGFGLAQTVPNGSDDFHGGTGTDTVQYGEPGSSSTFTSRAGAVSADPGGGPDDGAPGEGDDAGADIENFTGGRGDDTLAGGDGPSVLRGLAGGDTLRGGGGDDTLEGLGASTPAVEAAVDDGADDLDGQDGSDTINANEGDDKIEARDGVADTLNCGSGNDTGSGDRVDSINGDCEGIALPVEMPPETPIVPPVETPPVTTPPVTIPPPPPAAPPTVAQLLSLPSSRRCVSRRRFRVRVRSTIRGTVKRVTIFINGKRVKTVTGSRIGLPIDLRGLPKGRIRVRLRVELVDGRVATDTRTYRTCATKKRRGRLGRKTG